MMVIFFIGIGLASIATSWATTPLEISIRLCLIGVFAAIYHPVGLAMVAQGRVNTGMPLAIIGVFVNMGVACAAGVTGFIIDTLGWRYAFVIPGMISTAIGGLILQSTTFALPKIFAERLNA